MKSPESHPGRTIAINQIVLPASARTDTGAGDEFMMEGFEAVTFQLDVTVAATDVGDTLDVYVQTTIDGTNWVDIVHFTQVLGNGGAKRFFSKISASLALTEFENATALGAAAVRHIVGDRYRVRWAITDASTDNASFTFGVTASGT